MLPLALPIHSSFLPSLRTACMNSLTTSYYMLRITVSSHMAGEMSPTILYAQHDEAADAMRIDEGSYLVLEAAVGAFSCKRPRLPRSWDHRNRPHVAVLLSASADATRVFLSRPQELSATDCIDECEPHGIELEIRDLDLLPEKSIIEVRMNAVDYSYYRKDGAMWTKIAESTNPFTMEVFSYGLSPMRLGLVEETPLVCTAK